MKHLKIEYTNESGRVITLFDDPVAEMSWIDAGGGIRVEGKTPAPPSTSTANGVGSLLNLLTGASKARSESVVEEKKAELAEEKLNNLEAVPPNGAASTV